MKTIEEHNQQFDFESIKSEIEPKLYQTAGFSSLDEQFEKIDQPVSNVYYIEKDVQATDPSKMKLEVRSRAVIKQQTTEDVNLTDSFDQSESIPSEFLKLFTKYMTAPVAMYQGYCLAAKTQLVPSIQSFIDYCKDKDCKLFLYRIELPSSQGIKIRYGIIE